MVYAIIYNGSVTVAVCLSHQYYFILEFYEKYHYHIPKETDLIVMKFSFMKKAQLFCCMQFIAMIRLISEKIWISDLKFRSHFVSEMGWLLTRMHQKTTKSIHIYDCLPSRYNNHTSTVLIKPDAEINIASHPKQFVLQIWNKKRIDTLNNTSVLTFTK